MPLLNHPDIGDVQKYAYLIAIVTAVDSALDTVDFNGVGRCPAGSDIPLFYHCNHAAVERSNGALEGAAAAFSVDDRVIVQCEIIAALTYEPVRVIGFEDQPKSCAGWAAYFDNTYWEPFVDDGVPYASWNGSAWASVGIEEEEEEYIVLVPINNWEVDLRPTKMRITHTHPAESYQNGFILHNTCTGGGCPDWIVQDSNLISLEEKDCFFDGYDIGKLDMTSEIEAGSYTITNIEFYV